MVDMAGHYAPDKTRRWGKELPTPLLCDQFAHGCVGELDSTLAESCLELCCSWKGKFPVQIRDSFAESLCLLLCHFSSGAVCCKHQSNEAETRLSSPGNEMSNWTRCNADWTGAGLG